MAKRNLNFACFFAYFRYDLMRQEISASKSNISNGTCWIRRYKCNIYHWKWETMVLLYCDLNRYANTCFKIAWKEYMFFWGLRHLILIKNLQVPVTVRTIYHLWFMSSLSIKRRVFVCNSINMYSWKLFMPNRIVIFFSIIEIKLK